MKEEILRALSPNKFSIEIKNKPLSYFKGTLDIPTEDELSQGINNFPDTTPFGGLYVCIKFRGKFTMLLYDTSLAYLCTCSSYWYDSIRYSKYEWNSQRVSQDRPLIAMKNGKYLLIRAHSCAPLCKPEFDSIDSDWCRGYGDSTRHLQFHYAKQGGKSVRVTNRGAIIDCWDLDEEFRRHARLTEHDTSVMFIASGGLCIKHRAGSPSELDSGVLLSIDEAQALSRAYPTRRVLTSGSSQFTKSWYFSPRYGKVILIFFI